MALHNDFNICILNIFKEIDIIERFWKEIVFKKMKIWALKNTVTEIKNMMERFHNR